MDGYETYPTEDGSLTCRDHKTGELYHNRAGAFLEALMNYSMPADLLGRNKGKSEFALLDACFGLGYNTWVFLQELLESGLDSKKISVVGVENDETVLSLIPTILNQNHFQRLRQTMACSVAPIKSFGYWTFPLDGMDVDFSIRQADLRSDISQLSGDFDLVFHDPFSPSKMPELWTADIFAAYKNLLTKRRGAILTYSAACSVRGALKELGFFVYRTSSVGGKRGGTIASLSPLESSSSVFDLTNHELLRIGGPDGVPWRDPGLCSTRDEIIERRSKEQYSMQRSAR